MSTTPIIPTISAIAAHLRVAPRHVQAAVRSGGVRPITNVGDLLIFAHRDIATIARELSRTGDEIATDPTHWRSQI